ncbi:hypothetical protein [Roseomonas indoligenes]|nr:hypothetical protein [Pararoseomonas indoligenes]
MRGRETLAWLGAFAGTIAAPLLFAEVFLNLQVILRALLRGAL